MRCRKVRSYLSAYCSDELSGRRLLAVSDHLTKCEGCREEEQNFHAISRVGRELAVPRVSEEFNNRLLDRIARERFDETRTKAFFPKPIPSLFLRKVVPVFVTAALAIFFGVSLIPKDHVTTDSGRIADGNRSFDDSYLTVQPVNNPNLTGMLHKGWSLDAQLARSRRINRISNQLTVNSPFGFNNRGSLTNVTTRSTRPVPYAEGFYQVRPLFRVFESPRSVSIKEGPVVY